MSEFQVRRFRVREFSRLSSRTVAAQPYPGWYRMWHGYYQVSCYPGWVENRGWPPRRCKTMSTVALWGLLSILEYYKGEEFNFFELGAGHGDQCLTVAGVINHEILKDAPASYRLLAIEAEPSHYEWTRQAFESQAIEVIMVGGAIWRETGRILPFYLAPDPAARYGQALHAAIGREPIQVGTFTVDYLRRKHKFDRIHCVHMDVQGAEIDVIAGSMESIYLGLIDHFIIGTHVGPALEAKLRQQLQPTHRCLADIPRRGTGMLPGIKGELGGGKGGVQIWRKKELD